jgi:hypothetical protein
MISDNITDNNNLDDYQMMRSLLISQQSLLNTMEMELNQLKTINEATLPYITPQSYDYDHNYSGYNDTTSFGIIMNLSDIISIIYDTKNDKIYDDISIKYRSFLEPISEIKQYLYNNRSDMDYDLGIIKKLSKLLVHKFHVKIDGFKLRRIICENSYYYSNDKIVQLGICPKNYTMDNYHNLLKLYHKLTKMNRITTNGFTIKKFNWEYDDMPFD